MLRLRWRVRPPRNRSATRRLYLWLERSSRFTLVSMTTPLNHLSEACYHLSMSSKRPHDNLSRKVALTLGLLTS